MFEDIFARKSLRPETLLPFGFQKEGEVWRYSTEIKNGEFVLAVRLKPSGGFDTDMTERESGAEYVLYKTNAQGAYVGEIRTAVGEVLQKIADFCFEPAVFKSRQARALIDFAQSTYGDRPEFLWERFPDNAVFRRKDSKKWYGAVLTVKGSKLGLDTDEPTEIIDLRIKPEEMPALLAQEHYYPGWHMNKKSWYTVILNESIADEELFRRLKESYELARK